MGWSRPTIESTFLDHPVPLPFAHQGGDEIAPPNTLAAFEAAAQAGYRYFETDVHLTAGYEVIVIHGETDNQGEETAQDQVWLANRLVPIASLSVDQRRAIDLNGHSVPLLDELLYSFPEARLNIDAKNPEVVGPLLQVLERHKAFGRVCLASFFDKTIGELRDGAPDGTVTALARDEVANVWAACQAPASEVPPLAGQCVQVPVDIILGEQKFQIVDERFVDGVHKQNGQVHVWTINEPGQMHELLDLGVDGLMTDKPRLLRAVLQARGEWAR